MAAEVLARLLSSQLPADRALARAALPFDGRDQRLLAELVYGSLRWLRRIDHVLSCAAGRPLTTIDSDLLPVLRIAAVQILALDRIPPHAAVSEAVDEARRRRGAAAGGFVNAVLRRVARAPRFDAWPVEIEDARLRLAVEESHPDELVSRWWNRWGEERTRRILAANNGPRHLHLLAFGSRGGREALLAALSGEGVETRPSALSPLGLVVIAGIPLSGAAFEGGELYVQDEASQAAALIPAPAPGERVLDAAAAPGGKGLAVLAAQPAIRVVFADRSYPRMRTLGSNLERLGISAARLVVDAAQPAFGASFDRVLLDAPCSGTGTLRRHPELRWRFRPEELERRAAESIAMLLALANCVTRGGILQFVTCSIEAEENEAVVERFLARRPEFERVRIDASTVPPGDDGDLARGEWRLLPVDGHDGFTVHVLRRGP